MKEEFYVINLHKLKEIFDSNVESIEERMIITEMNETHELVDGELVITRKEVKKQLVTNESKLKMNQVLTHCLEILLIDKETIDETEGVVIDGGENVSDSYLLAFRTLALYGILEKKN